MWTQRGKLSKGIMSAKVYDEQNRLRVTVPPKKSLSYSGCDKVGVLLPARDLDSRCLPHRSDLG